METLDAASLARLRHDLRTPVNHILGYTELLIDDSSERQLEALVPVFQKIQDGGRQLLETIETALGEKTGPTQEVDLESFKQNLHSTAAEVLEASTSVVDNLENGHQQTLADLDAISRALRRLMDFSGEVPTPVRQK
jgi:signal transduction histidine kinase